MSNRDDVLDMMNAFTGQASIIAVPRMFIEWLGDLEKAVFVNQLLYWSDRATMEDRWFAKGYAEWRSEIALKEHTVREITKWCVTRGWLQTKLKKFNGNPTVHYQVNATAIKNDVVAFLRNRRKETEENGSCENAETKPRKQSNETAQSQEGTCENEDPFSPKSQEPLTKSTAETTPESTPKSTAESFGDAPDGAAKKPRQRSSANKPKPKPQAKQEASPELQLEVADWPPQEPINHPIGHTLWRFEMLTQSRTPKGQRGWWCAAIKDVLDAGFSEDDCVAAYHYFITQGGTYGFNPKRFATEAPAYIIRMKSGQVKQGRTLNDLKNSYAFVDELVQQGVIQQ